MHLVKRINPFLHRRKIYFPMVYPRTLQRFCFWSSCLKCIVGASVTTEMSSKRIEYLFWIFISCAKNFFFAWLRLFSIVWFGKLVVDWYLECFKSLITFHFLCWIFYCVVWISRCGPWVAKEFDQFITHLFSLWKIHEWRRLFVKLTFLKAFHYLNSKSASLRVID